MWLKHCGAYSVRLKVFGMEACGGCVSGTALRLAGHSSAVAFVIGSLKPISWAMGSEKNPRGEGRESEWKGKRCREVWRLFSCISQVKGHHGHSIATTERFLMLGVVGSTLASCAAYFFQKQCVSLPASSTSQNPAGQELTKPPSSQPLHRA